MKSLDQIRDEKAENAWLSPAVPTSTPTDHETFITLYCAGFDAAVAHLQSAGSAEFDSQVARDHAEGLSIIKIQGPTYTFVDGARWQFNQMQAERDSLFWEISKLQAQVTLGNEQMQAEIERLKAESEVWYKTSCGAGHIQSELKEERDQLKEQLAKLVDALTDFEENGLRCDMNPTQPMGDWMRVTDFYLDYLRRISDSTKLRARQALAELSKAQGEK